MLTQIACEEWQTEFSDCSICFLFSSFDIWYGQPGVGSPSSGVFGSLDCFAGFFAALAGAPLTSVVYYLILNE